MSFFFEDATGKHPFDLGDTIKVTTAAGIPFRWKLHADGLDRRVGDTFVLEHHNGLFEQHKFEVKAPDIVGDDPLIFEFKTKTAGFPAGVHRLSVMQTLRTICVIEVTATARTPIEIPPADRREDPPPRSRRRKGVEEDEAPSTRVEPGIWAKFGVRSLYAVMALIVLFTLLCGGFSIWTGGKIVNLTADWVRANVQHQTSEDVNTAPVSDPAAPPAVTPLESRPLVEQSTP